jgi:hypothetical protein
MFLHLPSIPGVCWHRLPHRLAVSMRPARRDWCPRATTPRAVAADGRGAAAHDCHTPPFRYKNGHAHHDRAHIGYMQNQTAGVWVHPAPTGAGRRQLGAKARVRHATAQLGASWSAPPRRGREPGQRGMPAFRYLVVPRGLPAREQAAATARSGTVRSACTPRRGISAKCGVSASGRRRRPSGRWPLCPATGTSPGAGQISAARPSARR